jgi:predicted TIM-barrel fold metal-dependent hydrolase
MRRNFLFVLTTIVIILSVAGCADIGRRNLSSFEQNKTCYDRKKEPYTFVVDAHMHSRPFGGASVPFFELTEYFNKTGVLFVNMFGIGQLLPVKSSCTYYLDCPGTPVLPSIKNDFANAANYLECKPQGVQIILAMTFMDLADPEGIVEMIRLYDKEYPEIFKWAGEVNLVKQALFNNGHRAITREEIDKWSEFMKLLKDRNIPITIHSDLGNNDEPTKFQDLMAYVLQKYPDNKIVWAHMGLSKELSTMDGAEHIQIMKSFLDNNPNLMLDVSWRVLDDTYFSKPVYRDLYVKFFNEYSERILPGTDFVASRDKDFNVYKNELEVNSNIFRYVNDEAFRNIVLGENYFRLLGLNYHAPQICD